MNKLIDSLVNEVTSRNRSSISIKHAIFLSPVHHEIAEHGCEDTNRLQRNIEAHKHEQVDNINVLIPNLKLNSFVVNVMFSLSLVQFAI